MSAATPSLTEGESPGSVLPKPDGLTRIAGVLKWLLVAASVWYVGSYLVVALLRIGYPFELEWMEGAVADHVLRILTGRPLYVSPSVEFVPFIYAPFYFYVSAGFAKVLGFSLFPLRLVSFLSSLACCATTYVFVRRETGSWYFGLIAAGLFAATFRAAGAWLDIARSDSLFLALSLGALYQARFSESGAGLAAAGVLFALAFHTKQTALFIALPVVAWSLATHRRRSLPLIGTFAVLAGGAVPVLNRAYHGWYNYYVFELPSHQPLLSDVLLRFWTRDLLLTVPVLLVLAAVLLARRCPDSERRARFFYLLAGAGMVAAAWFGRLHRGGYDNALLPAYAGLATLGVLCAWALTRPREAPRPGRKALTLAVYCACLVQFGLLWYNPAMQVPSRRDAQAGRELVATLAGLPGEIFMPQHGYLPELAGKRSFAHQMAICDVLNAGPSAASDRLLSDIAQAIGQHRFSAIVLDYPFILQEVVLAHYRPQHQIFSSDDVFWPRTGLRTRPEGILVPRSDARASPLPSTSAF
jgi:4-amino-4-deoxy-L-arabinose transferase-like glycosyltransferase